MNIKNLIRFRSNDKKKVEKRKQKQKQKEVKEEKEEEAIYEYPDDISISTRDEDDEDDEFYEHEEEDDRKDKEEKKEEQIEEQEKRTFYVCEIDSILRKREEEIEKLVEVFQFSKERARKVAERCGWDFSVAWDALERMNKDDQMIVASNGKDNEERETGDIKESCSFSEQVFSDVKKRLRGQFTPYERRFSFTCGVCFCSYDDEDDDFLNEEIDCVRGIKISKCPQDHIFCSHCWSNYLCSQIKNGFYSFSCMKPGCHHLLDDVNLVTSLLDKESLALYKYVVAKNYGESSKTIRWCPSSQCNLAICVDNHMTLSINKIKKVKCLCGQVFCFECGAEDHFPVSCETFQKWTIRSSKDSDSEKWIALYTRSCPNPVCKKPIEKNGGCPHMKCSKCQSDFCWTCMSLYVKGSHSCKGALLDNGTRVGDAEFERYRSVVSDFDRYTSQINSWLTQEKAQLEKMKEYRQFNREDWNQTEPYHNSFKILIQSLKVLKYSSSALYFISELARDQEEEKEKEKEKESSQDENHGVHNGSITVEMSSTRNIFNLVRRKRSQTISTQIRSSEIGSISKGKEKWVFEYEVLSGLRKKLSENTRVLEELLRKPPTKEMLTRKNKELLVYQSKKTKLICQTLSRAIINAEY